jgi:chromosome segregation protein
VLHFNKLRLVGFKSFVDNTELLVELGLTGVVGPNGCGKSNLVEGLRWAMGETSAKQMRGKEMDDVIFGGTSTRPPRNVAEVVLSLDNSQRAAPAQFNDDTELEVSRRIERDKGSTYRVNGKEVRARDVQLLFADSSTGARSTAMVSQGRIGAIIAAKPEQRRALLEEAAGITGLHSRRHEAELRLKGAETNLDRLDDILITLDTQLQSLKKQSRQATRYRNLSDHIRKAEAILFHLRWSISNVELDEWRGKFTTIQAQVTELTAMAGAATINQVESAEKLPKLRETEAEIAAELHSLTIAREGLDEEEARVRHTALEADNRRQQLERDEEREQAITEDSGGAVIRLTEEREQIELSREGESGAQKIAQELLERSNETVKMLESQMNQLTENVAASEAQRNGLSNRLREIDARMDRLKLRRQEIMSQRADIESQSPDPETVVGAEAGLEEARAALEYVQQQRDILEEQRTEAQEKIQKATSELQEVSAIKTALDAEEKTLERILTSNEGELWPPMIDEVIVEPGFETALGVAMGEDLSVSSDEAAPAHWRSFPPYDIIQALPGKIQPLSDVVKGPAALTRRLSQIGIVDDDKQGKILSPLLTQGQRIVSKTGSVWRWDGFTVSSGATTAAAARLEQRNRQNEVQLQLNAAQKKVNVAQLIHENACKNEEEIRGDEHTTREAINAAEHKLNEARDFVSKIKGKVTAYASRVEGLADASQANVQDIEETVISQNAAKYQFDSITDPVAERNQIAIIRAELAERRAEQLSNQSQYGALVREAEERAQRLFSIASEIQSWQQRHEASSKQLDALKERRESIRETLVKLEAKPAEITAQREILLESIEISTTKRSTAADALQAAENTLREADNIWRESEAALAQAREQMVRTEGSVEQARQTCLTISERVRDQLNCRTDQLFKMAELKEDVPLPELEASERRVDRLQRERETMGPVNLRAEQESNDMNEQINNLNAEREDLIQAIAKLRHGISELNREGRARLLSSFKEVNIHFQNLFMRLFGGGHAHLELTESDDPLDAGLEILARPPGKKLQALSLLSGGEQALTALALLFSVFLTNPAPICVLDEVDAPLDDANVDRFCTMLEEMAAAEKTRFLVITHHRMTMARMDRLFGVTMSERGVSQLVSVDLQHATELRDAG